MKANKEEGKRAIEVSSGKKKSHEFVRALTRFYSFSQLLFGWDQNKKTPIKPGFILRLSQGETIKEDVVKLGLFMSINPKIYNKLF